MVVGLFACQLDRTLHQRIFVCTLSGCQQPTGWPGFDFWPHSVVLDIMAACFQFFKVAPVRGNSYTV